MESMELLVIFRRRAQPGIGVNGFCPATEGGSVLWKKGRPVHDITMATGRGFGPSGKAHRGRHGKNLIRARLEILAGIFRKNKRRVFPDGKSDPNRIQK